MKQIKPSQSYIDRDRAASLLKKWAPLLEHNDDATPAIKDDHTKLNTAILLENQEKWCFEATNAAGYGGVFGNTQDAPTLGRSSDFYAQGDARLPKILIPMIRRTFPELITNEIVGVQPMSGPVGLAFALRYKYEQNPLGATAGDNQYGNNGANAPQGWTGANIYPNNTEVGWNYLNTNFTGTSATFLSGLGAGDTNFPILAADQGIAQLLSNFELTSNIPQMVVSFEKTAVEAGTRRLAARWSVELEQDLKNMNGIDVDNELRTLCRTKFKLKSTAK